MKNFLMKSVHTSCMIGIFLLGSVSLMEGKKYVITGGPGAGKSTLINFLKQEGYNVVPEAYTTIVEKAMAEGTDERLYSDRCAMKCLFMSHQCALEKLLDPAAIVFLDRSTIDVLAFSNFENITLPPDIVDIALNSQYEIAFFLEILPDPLYSHQLENRNKHARCEREKSVKLAAALRKEYQARGILCIDVPFDTTENRARFITTVVKRYEEKYVQ